MKRTSAVLLRLILVSFLLPALLLILASLLPTETANEWIQSGCSALISGSFCLTLEQYKEALCSPEFICMFQNSVSIAVWTLLFHLPVAVLSGLWLARTRIFGKRVVLFCYEFALLMPFQVIMLPVYQMSVVTGLYDSLWAVILLAIFSPMGILMMYVFIGGIPEEQWEATALETSSIWITLHRIVLPQLFSGFIVLLLLKFSDVWNMVDQPLILLLSDAKKPLSLSLNDIALHESSFAFAASALYAMPFFLFFAGYVLRTLWRRDHRR